MSNSVGTHELTWSITDSGRVWLKTFTNFSTS